MARAFGHVRGSIEVPYVQGPLAVVGQVE